MLLEACLENDMTFCGCSTMLGNENTTNVLEELVASFTVVPEDSTMKVRDVLAHAYCSPFHLYISLHTYSSEA